jgi:hypothetical protein
VKVWYWPRAFTEGLVLAVVAVAALGGAMLTGWVQRRRRVAVTTSPASANPADAAP